MFKITFKLAHIYINAKTQYFDLIRFFFLLKNNNSILNYAFQTIKPLNVNTKNYA